MRHRTLESGALPIPVLGRVVDTGRMNTTRNPLVFLLALTLVATACGSTAADSAATTTDPDAPSVVDQISLDEDDSATTSTTDASTGESTTTSTEVDETTTEPTVVDEVTEEPCTDPPAANDLRWVDVSLDDPDGGLNARDGAGTDNEILAVFPRRTELFTTGGCALDGDWWEVTTGDGSVTGWVASRYLSDIPVEHGGIGNEIDDPDSVGLEAETLVELVRMIAESYGHDEDLTITQVGQPEGMDAIGGTGTWDTAGLKDDASLGYRIIVDFEFLKDEDNGGEIVGFRAARVTNSAICSRGLTDDGLCT